MISTIWSDHSWLPLIQQKRRNLIRPSSREDLSQKLDSAASRKQVFTHCPLTLCWCAHFAKAQESDRVAKAAAAVEHAQAVARSTRAGLQTKEDNAKKSIANKLSSAQQAREAGVRDLQWYNLQ